MDIVEKTSGPGVYLFAVGDFVLHPDLLPMFVTGCSYFHGTIGLLPIPLLTWNPPKKHEPVLKIASF